MPEDPSIPTVGVLPQSTTTSAEAHEYVPRSLSVHYFANFCHEAGTYFRFHNLAVGLVRLGHQVTVFTCDFSDRGWKSRTESRDGVTYIIQPQHFLARYFFNACDPITVTRRFLAPPTSCDVAHLFQPFPGATLPWLRANCVARFYDWDDLWIDGLMSGPATRLRDHWPRACVGYLEKRLPRWADHVTTLSRFLESMSRDRGAQEVSIIHNGSWARRMQNKTASRIQLGLRNDAIYAGFMGRTTAELPWCIAALASNTNRFPNLRLALCGMPITDLDGTPDHIRDRIDYLGQLSPMDAQTFSNSLDLALLPMEMNNFNRSRFPIKFSDYLATGVPLLCSEVGECAQLIPKFPWVLPAGATRQAWESAFASALDRIACNAIPQFDPQLFERHLSWNGLSRTLSQIYLQVLDRKAASARIAIRP